MKDIKPSLHFWWIFMLLGTGLILLSIYAGAAISVTYDKLSLFFASIMILSGFVELAFCITNRAWFTGRGWYLVGAIIDILLGLIFGTNPILAAISLPLFAGIWLLVRSAVIIGRSVQVRKNQFSEWPWLLLWSLAGLFFSLINIYDPIFGGSRLMIWPALSLLAIGVFYLHFGLLIKNADRWVNKHIYT